MKNISYTIEPVDGGFVCTKNWYSDEEQYQTYKTIFSNIDAVCDYLKND